MPSMLLRSRQALNSLTDHLWQRHHSVTGEQVGAMGARDAGKACGSRYEGICITENVRCVAAKHGLQTIR